MCGRQGCGLRGRYAQAVCENERKKAQGVGVCAPCLQSSHPPLYTTQDLGRSPFAEGSSVAATNAAAEAEEQSRHLHQSGIERLHLYPWAGSQLYLAEIPVVRICFPCETRLVHECAKRFFVCRRGSASTLPQGAISHSPPPRRVHRRSRLALPALQYQCVDVIPATDLLCSTTH